MCAKCGLPMDTRFAPVILPLGGFQPMMCAICGILLRGRAHVFREGSVCNGCFYRLSPNVIKAAREWELEKGGGS